MSNEAFLNFSENVWIFQWYWQFSAHGWNPTNHLINTNHVQFAGAIVFEKKRKQVTALPVGQYKSICFPTKISSHIKWSTVLFPIWQN